APWLPARAPVPAGLVGVPAGHRGVLRDRVRPAAQDLLYRVRASVRVGAGDAAAVDRARPPLCQPAQRERADRAQRERGTGTQRLGADPGTAPRAVAAWRRQHTVARV